MQDVSAERMQGSVHTTLKEGDIVKVRGLHAFAKSGRKHKTWRDIEQGWMNHVTMIHKKEGKYCAVWLDYIQAGYSHYLRPREKELYYMWFDEKDLVPATKREKCEYIAKRLLEDD